MTQKATEKFTALLKGKGLLAAVQTLCPIDLHFQLLANMKYKGCSHDITVLLSLTGTTKLLQDPKDIEGFIANLLGEKGSDLQITCEKVKYDNKLYFAVFVDRPKQIEAKQLA